MDLSAVLVVVLVAAVVVGVYLWQRRLEEERRRRAAAFAASRGLAYLSGPMDPPGTPFEQLTVGHSRQVTDLMWRDGEPLETSAFQYRWVTGSGKNRTTHRCTCVLVRTGLGAPHLHLEREGVFRGLVRAIGIRDIEVESPEFNDTWKVECDDERFAITFLDPPMIAWLMSIEGGRGAVELELLGDRALGVMSPVPTEQLPELIEYARRFVGQIPRVLAELYPPHGTGSA